MNTSGHSRVLVFCSKLALGFGAALFVAGCSDTVTFSRSSQERGVQLYNQGEYADAAGAFRDTVRQQPKDYQSWYYLGQSQEKIGQTHEAIHSYRTALDVQNMTLEGKENVTFRQTIINSMTTAIAKSDSAETETQAAEAKARKDPSPENYLILAKICGNRGDADAALDAFSRSQRLDRNNYFLIKEYGLYLQRLGQNDKALPMLKRAYSMNPQDAEVQAGLRQYGIVPGPSLKDRSALAKPPVPEGPIPPVNEWVKNRPANATTPAPAPAGSPSPTAQTPRD